MQDRIEPPYIDTDFIAQVVEIGTEVSGIFRRSAYFEDRSPEVSAFWFAVQDLRALLSKYRLLEDRFNSPDETAGKRQAETGITTAKAKFRVDLAFYGPIKATAEMVNRILGTRPNAHWGKDSNGFPGFSLGSNDALKIPRELAAGYLIVMDTLAEALARAQPSEGSNNQSPGGKKRTGRKKVAKNKRGGQTKDLDLTKQVGEAWASGHYKKHEELANALGLSVDVVEAAKERYRKQQEKNKKREME